MTWRLKTIAWTNDLQRSTRALWRRSNTRHPLMTGCGVSNSGPAGADACFAQPYLTHLRCLWHGCRCNTRSPRKLQLVLPIQAGAAPF